MNTATHIQELLESSPEVSRLLQAIPREGAPRALTASMRRALSRERRQAPIPTPFPLWPAAAAVQLALLTGLCALYFFATPPTAIVVKESSERTTESASNEANAPEPLTPGPEGNPRDGAP
mgnify:CR=1 FL=1